jgi:hypothetical protein
VSSAGWSTSPPPPPLYHRCAFSHGTLALNHTEPNAFSPEQVELLMELAETLEEGFRRMDDLQELGHSLAEKVVLLKEVHHRVKNNLQVISSLLASAIEDPTALRCIENSRAQVQSMALIHERLYELDDLARLDCAEYVQALAENVFSSYGVDPDVARDNGTSFEVNYPIDSQSQRDLSEPNGR